MKRHWIEYADEWVPGPMSFWVHRAIDGKPWPAAQSFDPPPVRLPGRGYPRLFVEFAGATLYFASLWELRECIQTLAKRTLPTSRKEAIRHFASQHLTCGPNKHWLSRLPAVLLPWSRRRKVVEYLERARSDFQREIGAIDPRALPPTTPASAMTTTRPAQGPAHRLAHAAKKSSQTKKPASERPKQ